MEQKTIRYDNSDNNNRIVCSLRKDGFKELLELGYLNKKNVNGPLEFHSHEHCLEITYHISGKQEYTVISDNGVNDYIVSGGEIFVTYPSEKHGSGQYFEDVSKLFWLAIYFDDAYDGFLNLKKEEAQYLIKHFNEVHPRHKKGTSEIRRGLNRILSIYKSQSPTPIDAAIIQNTVFSILCDILKSPDVSVSKEIGEIHLVKDFIDGNIEQKFDIAMLAKKCYLSESHFKHKFKQIFGIPPTEYIIRKKIEYAKTLLSTTDLSVTEIAMQLGFCSCSYFNKTFKRFVWSTPKQYRIAKRNETSDKKSSKKQ